MYHREMSAEKKHVAAIEMDDGSERPLGFQFGLQGAEANSPRYVAAKKKLEEIVGFLDAIGVNRIVPGSGGTDIGPLTQDGIPGLGLFTTREHYFDWHHTQADTLDKVDPQDLRRCIAALAVMAYVLADMPERLAN
jgi:Zn-dependent M28 family amino/carboxypeptidase